MVLRQYLCNPRSAIINTTSILRRKRHEFINAISDGSISLKSMPSIPPNVTKPKSTTMSQKHINATAKVSIDIPEISGEFFWHAQHKLHT